MISSTELKKFMAEIVTIQHKKVIDKFILKTERQIIVMVNVIGMGYIGLPTALMMAAHGINVVGSDYDNEKIKELNDGNITFEEKGLKELFEKATNNGIRFSGNYERADIYIISVPTPYDKTDKKINPEYVVSAVNGVLKICGKGAILVIESTISPGTIDKYVRPTIERNGLICGEDIHIAHAPERIIPGNMIYELVHNNRTIGADSVEIGEKIKMYYQSFCEGEITITDIRTAEMTKVVENTFRDINIAFANELAKICSSDGMDVYEIIRIANKHPRVNILKPGPGVGGHCISVDPWFLVGDYSDITNVILAAREVNDGMPAFVLKRIKDIMREQGIKDSSKVGLYGLTYKANVDDTRESPTIQMLDYIKKNDSAFKPVVYDPYVDEKICEGQVFKFNEFIDTIDMLVILVGHNEIKDKREKIEDKIILDTCETFELSGIYRI